ncbi:MAG TPA: GGDEF domain-containing protein [Treponema sp.]|nr:GGDEF domain-containing protein [Treponema sp.]
MNILSSRKRIGIQIQQMGPGYSAKIWPGAVDCAESRDVDLIIFPGQNLDSPYGFEYQNNVIYQMMTEKNIDALVLNTALIGNFVDFQTIKNFCYSIKNIPVVSVGTSIPGIPSIIINNKYGIREMVCHFVKEHQARRIAFVKGPENNWEAQERFAAYQEEMAAQNLPVYENLIVQGDFTWFKTPAAIDELLQKCGKLPDAIMFANDEMALQSTTYLQEKGFTQSNQIGISGFDDLDECHFTSPQLTSIRQPLYEMAWKAIETTLDMLDGKPVEKELILPTKMVVRTSCGCQIESINNVYRTVEKVNTIQYLSSEFNSMYDCVVFLLSPKHLNQREDTIKTVIQKLYSLSELTVIETHKQQQRIELMEFYKEVLKAEIGNNLKIKDWILILSAVSESLYTLNLSLEKEREIQLNLRFCTLLTNEISQITENSQNNRNNIVQNVLRDVLGYLSTIVQTVDLNEALYSYLPLLDIKTFFLFSYEKPWIHEKKTNWEIPESVNFISGMIGEVITNFNNRENKFSTLNLFPDNLINDSKRRTFLVYPLYFRETHYGMLTLELSKGTGFIIESLVLAISNVIKSIHLYRSKEKVEEKLRETLIKLEENNEKLSNLSITDELTGLYNRRGFMTLANQQNRLNLQMKKNALVIFLDIDGLKLINDGYGHDEGDWIIRMTAEVLRKTFRTMDIIARLGGDEFTVFTPNAGIEVLPVFQKRMEMHVLEINKEYGKPFKLSLSIGAVECSFEEDYDLDDYMKKADEELYKEKRRKKELRKKGNHETL